MLLFNANLSGIADVICYLSNVTGYVCLDLFVSTNNTSLYMDSVDSDERRRAHEVGSLAMTLSTMNEYYEKYVQKSPQMNSSFIDDNLTHFHNMFRMSQRIFMDLLWVLCTSHGLHGSSRTITRELLALTLYILAQNESIRATCERFQHSSETISKYFHIGLNALLRLSIMIVEPIDPTFTCTPNEILNDGRYMYFKVYAINAILLILLMLYELKYLDNLKIA